MNVQLQKLEAKFILTTYNCVIPSNKINIFHVSRIDRKEKQIRGKKSENEGQENYDTSQRISSVLATVTGRGLEPLTSKLRVECLNHPRPHLRFTDHVYNNSGPFCIQELNTTSRNNLTVKPTPRELPTITNP